MVNEHVVIDHQPGLVERTFDTGEVQLNYAEGPANGPPLVLIHGLGRRWQVFLPIIPALSLRWHIFAPDLRGHGKSSHVARGYHGPQYSEDIARRLQRYFLDIRSADCWLCRLPFIIRNWCAR
jgi:pimeloyl-ACP methyl ester carboxylesterase